MDSMCNIFGVLVALFLIVNGASAQDCTVNGIRLQGDVKVVETLGDVKVYVDTVFTSGTLEVRFTPLPSSCGDWHIVDNLPDFTVEIVTARVFADTIVSIRPNRKNKTFLEKYVR